MVAHELQAGGPDHDRVEIATCAATSGLPHRNRSDGATFTVDTFARSLLTTSPHNIYDVSESSGATNNVCTIVRATSAKRPNLAVGHLRGGQLYENESFGVRTPVVVTSDRRVATQTSVVVAC